MKETKTISITEELIETPKMIEVYLDDAWQTAFCYGLAYEKPKQNWQRAKLLLTIIAGNDSTVQAMKAAIDIGSSGLSFGNGEKGLTDYTYTKELELYTEKGKYEKFPMTIINNRKAIVVVHDELMGNDDYILSFTGDPAEDLRTVLGGGKFGLHILPEWKDIIFHEFLNIGILQSVDIYFDSKLFPKGFSLFKLQATEEEVDNLISKMIKEKKLRFRKEGTGTEVEMVSDLTEYMQQNVEGMIKKVSREVSPIHNPLVDHISPKISTYKRELFPVQAHVSTAVAKKLAKSKAVIIQGEMSTGKSTIMTAVADVLSDMKNKEGYHSVLMCPPSLTKKWPEEIKEIIPHAEVRVIERTSQLITYHRDWLMSGRKKPKKPVFFVISFTTMRGDSSIVPAVQFSQKKTSKQQSEDRLPYRYGYYCPSCGKAHQVIEDIKMIPDTDEPSKEIEVRSTRTMDKDEFGTGRRLQNTQKPANAFCSECGESLWTKKVATRYSSIKEWYVYEKKLIHAIKEGNKNLLEHIQSNQKEVPKKQGQPRRVASIEYIRRKMKNFFDIAIVDEIHERVTRYLISVV